MSLGNKSDMDFSISANIEKAVQDMAKVIAKQDESIAKLKEANREGKKGADTFGEWTRAFGVNVGEIATGIGLAKAGMEAIKITTSLLVGDYEKIQRLAKEAHQQTLNFNQQFMGMMSKWPAGAQMTAGQQDVFRQQMINAAAEMKITPEKAMGAAGAFAEQYRNATPAQVLEATRRYGPAQLRGGGTQMAAAGGFYQEIYGIGGAQAGALAAITPPELEQYKPFLQRAEAAGTPREEALAMIMGAAQTDQPGRSMQALMGMYDVERSGKIKNRTPRDIAQDKLAGVPQAQRWAWLAEHPTEAQAYLGEQYFALKPLLDPGRLAANRGRALEAMAGRGPTMETLQGEFAGTIAGGGIMAEEQLQSEEQLLWLQKPELAFSGLIRRTMGQLLNEPGIPYIQERAIQGLMKTTGVLGFDQQKTALGVLKRLQTNYGEERWKGTYQTGFGTGPFREIDQANPQYDPAAAGRMGEYIKIIEEGAARANKQLEYAQKTQESGQKVEQKLDKLIDLMGQMVQQRNWGPTPNIQ